MERLEAVSNNIKQSTQLTGCFDVFQASGLKAVTLQEAKVLLKDDDDLIIAVYDYWLNKRLRLAHALIPQVRGVMFALQHHCRLQVLFYLLKSFVALFLHVCFL